MARDATLRLYDVDKDSVKLDIKNGLIRFGAKKGKLVDLDKLHESFWATRLSGRTGMELHALEVTAAGEVMVEKEMLLKVTGSSEHFVLADDSEAKPPDGQKTPFQELREALARGEKFQSVSGRLDGWSGPFPRLLKELPQKPRRLIVKGFEIKKSE